MRWLDGITDSMDEFGQTLGDSEGQGRLARCSLQGSKESDMIERLNNTLVIFGCPLWSPLHSCSSF